MNCKWASCGLPATAKAEHITNDGTVTVTYPICAGHANTLPIICEHTTRGPWTIQVARKCS